MRSPSRYSQTGSRQLLGLLKLQRPDPLSGLPVSRGALSSAVVLPRPDLVVGGASVPGGCLAPGHRPLWPGPGRRLGLVARTSADSSQIDGCGVLTIVTSRLGPPPRSAAAGLRLPTRASPSSTALTAAGNFKYVILKHIGNLCNIEHKYWQYNTE